MTDRVPPRAYTRRRALTIIAAGAGAALIPGGDPREAAGAGAPRLFEWRGIALGGAARIVLFHDDRGNAERAVGACVAEIERLEAEFSLYRDDSALCRLNRDGALAAPSHDMIAILEAARRIGALSGGAFDVTVQPLWRLYAEHFARRPEAADGPPPEAIAAALALVDGRRIAIAPERIGLGPGMAVTLNGIAQGYITDRVADLLRARGWRHVLLDLGEIRALDGRADGTPWRVGIAEGPGPAPARTILRLTNRAVATSAGYGMRFDRSGRHHHLFDPRLGRSPDRYRSVSVVAPRATVADALSTALYALAPAEALRLLRKAGPAEAYVTRRDGGRERWTV